MTTAKEAAADMVRVLRSAPEDLAADTLGWMLAENGGRAIRAFLCSLAAQLDKHGVVGTSLPIPATSDEIASWLRDAAVAYDARARYEAE